MKNIKPRPKQNLIKKKEPPKKPSPPKPKGVKPKPAQKEETEQEPLFTDLRQIMDYSVPFKMIYSGVENQSYYDILYNMGIRDFLMSYHYVQNKHLNLDQRFDEQGDVRLLIDSGAYTYHNDPKYYDVTVEEWEKHVVRYLKWAERNKDHIFAIANCDFELMLDPAVVDRWNREYFEPFMLRTGIPVCFVWHEGSYRDWDFYCQRYPYVGFSAVSDTKTLEMSDYNEKMQTAEKYNALVHGFGMTRTGYLTEVPFYTSDSTTWLVGLQYGEINYWTGSKMSRLKKDVWKTQPKLGEIASKYGLDASLLEDEKPDEMIKANVGAFIDAEKFIHERLKSRMYWMRAKTNKTDLGKVDWSTFFPSAEQLLDDSYVTQNLKELAVRFNINPDCEEARDYVIDCVVFMNWDNPEYESLTSWYKSEDKKFVIDEIHNTLVNRIVATWEDRVDDLRKFYQDTIEGNNDKLLQMGTNFDRIVKEREDYIMPDNDFELRDIENSLVKQKLQNILATDGDLATLEDIELDKLDEEIYKKAEIIPTWGADGKFLKGQVAVRKPKKIYSELFPKMACDTCHAAQKCPEYKAGFVCAYDKMFKQFETRNIEDVENAMRGIVDLNLTRMQKAAVMETITGNISPDLTQLMQINMTFLERMHRLSGRQEVIRQTNIMSADGTYTSTTSVQNPQNGSILEKLFTSDKKDKVDENTEDPDRMTGKTVVNARYTVVEEEE